MAFETSYQIEIRPGPLTGAEAKKYCEETRMVLSQVWATDSGNALMTALSKTKYWTSIEPYDGKHGTCNAWAYPVSERVRGRQFLSRITFTAGQVCKNEFAGLPNEYLHHELVHALRQTSGKWTPIGLGKGMEQYKNWEELYAVVVTNIYISDESNTYKSKLRGEYAAPNGLEPEFSESLTFFRKNELMFPLLDQFCTSLRDYTTSLVRVKAQFNPIAAIYQDRKVAERMSNSTLSSGVGAR